MLSMLVVGYLFLGGVGAGACVVVSAMALLVPRAELAAIRRANTRSGYVTMARVKQPYRRLIAPCYAAAFATVFLGCLFLLLDLGNPAMALALFRYPTATFISAGSYALAACLAVTLLLGIVWGASGVHVPYRLLRAAEWFAAVVGLFVTAYTGLLLSTLGTVPFWTSAWLPVLFVLSSLSGGCALVLIVACVFNTTGAFRQVLRRLVRCDIVVIVLEAAAAAMLLASAFSHPYDVAAQGAQSLLTGAYAGMFLVGFGACGLVAPLVLELNAARWEGRFIMLIPAIAALVLVGAFLMRYCIVAAGMHPEVWTVL
ncbi:Formate-dependent nitrite reductase, membrane component [Slackia heliotrinireducens]|uniref:Formate-dependent nitrite reductase, membrane component n=1 Tax=Slackia heliotrinireducens (strain ATCC 29202 / DSM 20476 / NCTC 11029 / RHS 1) TaxID=471855 RepID=C7N1I6_SLAHD|nr:NrfD/PsrC family molybdoenzyme membrane anchor subunit [Slackia heliotrinireducens]ACV21278.1 formate-dependent nitrite reductase, membrane component [Slackia heliotrinireducens DSM 20476]VEG98713.1 Formate-dependent nitrite reductase, membrane component [Slackia heliotrinireducens]